MSQTLLLTPHDKFIVWMVEYINKNPNTDLNYKSVLKILSAEKQYFIKGYLIDNRYLYGSFVKEALSKANKC